MIMQVMSWKCIHNKNIFDLGAQCLGNLYSIQELTLRDQSLG